jgi:hypothetical protein
MSKRHTSATHTMRIRRDTMPIRRFMIHRRDTMRIRRVMIHICRDTMRIRR